MAELVTSIRPDSMLVHQPCLACSDSTRMGLRMTAAVVVLGWTLYISGGTLHPVALAGLTATLLAVLGAVAVRSDDAARTFPPSFLDKVLSGCLVVALAFTPVLLSGAPASSLSLLLPGTPCLLLIASACLGLCGCRLNIWFPLFASSWLILGVWLISTNPHTGIDVVVIHNEALNGLLAGLNPYAMTYTDVYGPDSPFTVPGTSVNGRLVSGFPYPPLSLLLAVPGYVLGGDYRYSQLVANVGSAFLMAFARPSRRSGLAAALFLLTPTSLFVLRMGWTEPFLVLLLSGVVFSAIRIPKLVPLFLGLLFAVKQHMFLVALPAFLLLTQFSWAAWVGLLFRAVIVSVAVYLPFLLWDAHALVRSLTTTTLYGNYFRLDSLSYPAWIATETGLKLPRTLALVSAALAASLGRLLPHTPAAFAAMVAAVYLTFFAWNNVSFCNHYFFVLGACACSVAALRAPEGGDRDR